MCWIIHAPEKDIIEAGYTVKIVIRHERGHCNNWPSNHPGSRVPTAADRGQENTKTQTAKPVEPTKPIKPAALSDEDIDGLMAAIVGDEAVQAYG